MVSIVTGAFTVGNNRIPFSASRYTVQEELTG